MDTKFMKWGKIGCVLLIVAALGACNAVAGSDVAASNPTVWISLESSAPVEIDNVRTAQLKLDFSTAIAKFKDDLSLDALAKLFKIDYKYKAASANMTVTSLKKYHVDGIYILTVINVPHYIAEEESDSDGVEGVASLTINDTGITPDIREWYVNGEVVVADGSPVLLDFRFEADANGLSSDAIGWVDQKLHTVTVTVPANTDRDALIPTLLVNDGNTANLVGEDSFSAPVTYTVTALGGATQDYVVTVSALPEPPAPPPPIPDTDPNFTQVIAAQVNITGTGSVGAFQTGRTVTLSPYKISKYETTWALWDAVVKEGIAQGLVHSGGYVFTDDNAFQGHQDLTPETRVPERTGGDMNADTNGYSDARLGKMAKGTSLLTEAEKTQRAVTWVSWFDMIAWCNLYSELTGRDPVYTYNSAVFKSVTGMTSALGRDVAMDRSKNGYRLPTEAEWEFAARGGNQNDTTTWGYKYPGVADSNQNNVAWYYYTTYPGGGNFVGALTDYGVHPVAKKNANSLGLFDMSGNVADMCFDRMNNNALTGTVTDPTGLASGEETGEGSLKRVARGGHWFSELTSTQLGVTDRGCNYEPIERGDSIGFRLAFSVVN